MQDKLTESFAYAVISMKVTKVPIVGAGSGEGIMVFNKTKQRINFTVRRFDIGGGWGVRSFKSLMIMDTKEIVERWKNGRWSFQAGAEASAGTAAAEGASGGGNDGFSLHVLAEGGASATATARVIRFKVINELIENP